MGVTGAVWRWPQASMAGGVDGSAMEKLFRGQELSDAALLAREALQNSTDAYRRVANGGVAPPPFRAVFRYERLTGDAKAKAVDALGLAELQERRRAYGAEDPLRERTALDHLDDLAVPLNLLYVEDYGTHGLTGDPRLYAKSHLFKAMYYLGSSNKGPSEGGSYGFGKSALLRASRTRTVIAYSAFQPSVNDPCRTRLVGFTWWRDLQEDQVLCEGRGALARFDEGARDPLPYENEEADSRAELFGIGRRDSDDAGQRGTTFLIIDPAVEAEDLLHEIEKWWWPALEEFSLDISVIDRGKRLVPRPRDNEFVCQFYRPFRIARGDEEPADPRRERLASKEWRNRSGTGGRDLGEFALVAGESPAEGEEAPGETLVALMRGPRMVVTYMRIGTRGYPLRGVFIASERANDLLRETEPATHDRWTTNPSSDIRSDATETASAVIQKIRRSVRAMARELAPPPPKTQQRLAHLGSLLGPLFKTRGVGGGQGSAPSEPIHLTYPEGRPSLTVVDADLVTLRTTFEVTIDDAAPGAACEVEVRCVLSVYEDDEASSSRVEAKLSPTADGHSFEQQEDGAWVGVLCKGEPVKFTVASEPYSNLWTVAVKPTVTRLGAWAGE